jgi:ribosomal protein L11 methyltransferase
MTFTAFTTCDNKDKAIRIAGALEKICPAPFGVGIFELEDGSNIYEIGSYFLEKPNDIKLTLLSSAFNAKPFVVSEVPETDWVAMLSGNYHQLMQVVLVSLEAMILTRLRGRMSIW